MLSALNRAFDYFSAPSGRSYSSSTSYTWKFMWPKWVMHVHLEAGRPAGSYGPGNSRVILPKLAKVGLPPLDESIKCWSINRNRRRSWWNATR